MYTICRRFHKIPNASEFNGIEQHMRPTSTSAKGLSANEYSSRLHPLTSNNKSDVYSTHGVSYGHIWLRVRLPMQYCTSLSTLQRYIDCPVHTELVAQSLWPAFYSTQKYAAFVSADFEVCCYFI